MNNVIQLPSRSLDHISTPKETLKDGLQKRGKYYHFVKKINGRLIKCSTKQITREMAKLWVEKNISQPEQERQLGIKPITQINFNDFIENEFLPHVKISKEPSTYQYYIVKCKHLKEAFGQLNLIEITPALIQKYQHTRAEDYKKGAVKSKEKIKKISVNKELTALTTALNYAIDMDFLKHNPVTRIKRLPVEEYEPTFISEEDFNQKFLPAANPRNIPGLTELYIFYLYVGARKNEALSLKWSAIDFKRRIIYFHRTKNKKTTKIPMNDFIYEIFINLKNKSKSEYVFSKVDGTQRKSVRDGFINALKRAGLPRMRLHDLRHSFVSLCADKGISWDKTSLITGHQSYQMYKRYRHFFDHAAREVVNSFQAPSNYKPKEAI